MVAIALPPLVTTVWGVNAAAGTHRATLAFAVPAGHYYKVTVNTGSTTEREWLEWDQA